LFLAMYLIATNKQGMSARSLAKHLLVSEVTAWHLLHKLRSAMQDRDAAYQVGGVVEVDETYVGGLASGPGTRGRSTRTKTPVLAVVEKRGDNLTGYIHLQPLVSIGRKSLHQAICDHVTPGATIRTDGLASYQGLDQLGYHHQPENSLGGKRACAQFKLVHRQCSNLKSWLLGTHRNTCRRHLDRYIAEFNWRTNRRNRYSPQGRPDHRERLLPEAMIQTVACSHSLTWMEVRRKCWLKPRKSRKAA
jgi:transposase-like protein